MILLFKIKMKPTKVCFRTKDFRYNNINYTMHCNKRSLEMDVPTYNVFIRHQYHGR